MILVGQYDSPYVRRVAVSLHLLGIPFSRNTLSGFADAEAMRRINPLGRIPSLILDDGEVLIDSWAILDHLDSQVGPERALLPPPGRARRDALFEIALATGALDKAGAMIYERTLRPPEKLHQPWVERCRTQVTSGLAALEARTPPSGWSGGDRILQPDITAACALAFLKARLPEVVPPGAHPRLESLLGRFAELELFRLTQWTPDETMPSQPL